MHLTRREVLRVLGGAALAVPTATACDRIGSVGGRTIDTIGGVAFDQPIAIPPLAEAEVDGARRVFNLTAQSGRRVFHPGRPTRTWGVNGDYLGPTLRARRGDQVTINVRNALGEPTTMHWHGMHLPAVDDGGPHQMIEPGQTWSPTWRIDQPAATLWYHPHPHGATERHVYRGLAGMFIVDDDVDGRLDLPRRYGIDDIPVMVQDKRFSADGQFVEGEDAATGLLGDTLLVNGTLGPYLSVTTERLRLRLLNASTARIYEFGFSDDRPFDLIGTDGGLLDAAYQTDRIQLSPGERAQVVVTVRSGEHFQLRSFAPHLGTNALLTRVSGGLDSFDVLDLRAGVVAAAPAVSGRLVVIERLPATAATITRRFTLGDRTINGRRMSMTRIDEVVTAGTTELWQVVNQDAVPHSFHIHDVQFQVLNVGNGPPPRPLSGWKDTVYVPPNTEVRLIMRFGDYTDPSHPYMYHCHLLLHEDSGMMGQFVVVEPGQRPGVINPDHHHH